jgi:hypothetical protein
MSSVRIDARSLIAFDSGGSCPAGKEAPPGWVSNAAPAQAAPEQIKERRDTKRTTSLPRFFTEKANTDYIEPIIRSSILAGTALALLAITYACAYTTTHPCLRTSNGYLILTRPSAGRS